MIDHLGIQCQDMPTAAAFYDTVLAPLGGRRIFDHGVAIGYGFPPHANFWIGELADGVNRPVHVCFQASDRDAVRAFFDAATATGAEVLHEPRVWPEYHANYFGAFVRDPDGNNVEACCHTPE